MKFPKPARIAAALVAAATLLAGCASNSPAGTSSASGSTASDALARIQAAGEIKIGLEGVYPPYSYHDASGQLTGLEKDFADKIAEDLGVTPVYIETKWDSLIAGVDVDRYDIVINNLAVTDERAQKYDFTERYARSIGKVAVAKDSPINSLDEISGKRAAQTPTSNWAGRISGLGATIVPVEGFVQALDLVNTGRADLTLNDLVTFQTYFGEHPDNNVRLLDGEVAVDNCCAILLKKGETSLQTALNDSISKRLADGTFAAISEQYVGTDLTPKS